MFSVNRIYPVPAMRRNPNWLFDDDFFRPFTNVAPMHAGVRETETSYFFDAELPGFDPEEINVSVQDGVLTIAAEQAKKSEDSAYAARSMHRSFTLNGIDEDAISAEYKNGVLHIALPKEKVPEAKAARKISISCGGKLLPEQ